MNKATFYAILAAALYAINIPVSKTLLTNVGPATLASALYLGAGFGMLFVYLALGKNHYNGQKHLNKKDTFYTFLMVVLDIAAPIFLMIGLSKTNSANVSLLNNFEIVATSIIAFAVFKEVISKRLFAAIAIVMISSVLLSFEGEGSFAFNTGSLYVLLACICWGLENNSTRKLSEKSSYEIVIVKGILSGTGSFLVSRILSEDVPNLKTIGIMLLLGFVAYGLSIFFYVLAQKDLGAAKTSAYYSIAPFLGVVFSFIILSEKPNLLFYPALVLMIIATVIMINDSIKFQHTHMHVHVHSHEHSHGDLVHTHEHSHEHSHSHVHGSELDNHDHNSDHLSDHNHSHN